VPNAIYERSVRLPARPDVVFWDLLEPRNVADYDSRMRSWIPRDYPPEVGTRVDFEAKLGPVWSKGVSEVVGFDPPHHIEVQLMKPQLPVRSTMTWRLIPTEEGTEFTYRFSAAAPRGMGWLGHWLVRLATAHLDTELPALVDRYK